MRNGDNNRDTESLTPGAAVYRPGEARRSRRRKLAAGAVGLLAILGVGGIVADQVFDDADTSLAQTGALQPVAPSASASATASGGSAAPSASAAPPVAAKPRTSATPRPKTTAERIAAVRSLAAKPNDQVRRPPEPNGAAAAIPVTTADVTTTQSLQNGERLTVSSARQDLTGYNHLGLVADPGVKYGEARCTKKIKVRAAEKPRERPTLLICWRTTATKSVYTMAVKLDGRPDPKLSVAALDKEWAKLG
jgi:hypothetical protein